MLAELNLKLIEVGGPTGGAAKSPASGTSPTPGAHAAAAGSPPAPGGNSPPAPAGTTATLTDAGDEDSTDSFRWDGDEDGVPFEDASSLKHRFPFTHLPPPPLLVAGFQSSLSSPPLRALLLNR
jgi:hypothetical protein